MRKDSRDLCELARNEIELAFRLLDEAMAAQNEDLRSITLRHARLSFESAEIFLRRAPSAEASPFWTSQLAALKDKIETLSSSRQEND